LRRPRPRCATRAPFRRRGAFRPEREQDPDLIFGHGTHHCLGSDLAMAQITEIFLALLKLKDLRPAAASPA
jgi:cytochrome P450